MECLASCPSWCNALVKMSWVEWGRGTDYPNRAFALFSSDIDLAIPNALVHAPESFPREKKQESGKCPP
jgi:hypothetical protein